MLKREIKLTADGSPTLYIPAWEESYHSKHGALQEAMHVFIKNGYHRLEHNTASNILEYGFGTGLNALITCLVAEQNQSKVIYHTIEKYPIGCHEIENLCIPESVAEVFHIDVKWAQQLFKKIHEAAWDEEVEITHYFTLKKLTADFKSIALPSSQYHLVYFDAFGKRVQPELWSEAIFKKAYDSLKLDGLLTTYACNGDAKRALKNIGFEVEKLSGPPGKREMINAWKK